MVFEIKMAYALELIALVGGAFLVMKGCQAPDCHRRFGKIVGWFAVVVALLLMLCTAWHSYVFWKSADFCPQKAMGLRGGRMGPRGDVPKHMMRFLEKKDVEARPVEKR
jgi:hypothetical protein